jgi:hypothetical protein
VLLGPEQSEAALGMSRIGLAPALIIALSIKPGQLLLFEHLTDTARHIAGCRSIVNRVGERKVSRVRMPSMRGMKVQIGKESRQERDGKQNRNGAQRAPTACQSREDPSHAAPIQHLVDEDGAVRCSSQRSRAALRQFRVTSGPRPLILTGLTAA